MSTTHTLLATIEVPLWGDDPDADVALVKIEIAYGFLPGYAPTWDDPGSGDEIDNFFGARLIDGGGLPLTEHQTEALAHAYLASDYGYRHACAEARDSKLFH